MKKSRIFICSALLSLFAMGSEQLSAQTIFTDVSRSPKERAEDIVKHMTLDEKVALMIYNSPAVERLGIRKYNWWNEALHGVARNGNATVFPMPIGMAASFDTELLEEVFTSISDEGRIKWGIARDANDQDMWYKGLSYWTPNINIFRDPRWGRGMETYGEDPYLTGQLGMAVVRGLQGPRDGETIKAMACAKHYALHSGPEWSRHSFDAVASERDVWETYLPAFKDLVTKAKVDQVMFAYNRIFGFPAGANERFMRDILEKEWGFEGIVVSDCWAVTDFYDGHKWSKNRAEAVATAVKTGMDLECGAAMPAIPKAIKDGLITEEELNEGITKVME
jgi:beta-glucosidase